MRTLFGMLRIFGEMRLMAYAGAAVVLASLLLVSGVAWAKENVIQCPRPLNPDFPRWCHGTDGPDVMIGTDGPDEIFGWRGADIVYGKGGDDRNTNDEDDWWYGEDTYYGGTGNDYLGGNYKSERHFGGRGNDFINDHESSRYPDRIRCGRGHDTVVFNRGLDHVAADCEVLRPAKKSQIAQ